jgi:hypothetical protein
MVERFNGRVGSEVLGITIWSHAQLEQPLRGFNAAYNARRQRVLNGKTPDQVVRARLRARRRLARPKPETPEGRAGRHHPRTPHRRGRQGRLTTKQSPARMTIVTVAAYLVQMPLKANSGRSWDTENQMGVFLGFVSSDP